MSDLQITDNAGAAIDGVPQQIHSIGSLAQYLLTEPLHLAVVPDVIKVAKRSLNDFVTADPFQASLTAQHDFQFGTATPQVNLTPEVQIGLGINAKEGADLFSDEPFDLACTVPANTAYVSLAFTGSLDAGVTHTPGSDITVGFDNAETVTYQYCRAFGLGASAELAGEAIGHALANFVIPATVEDLELLQPNDVVAVSGSGTLTLSASFSVSLPATPLASVDLPLSVGTIGVQAGLSTSLSGSFAVQGSYQLRARKTDPNTVQLMYSPSRSTTFSLATGATAGLTATLGSTDLIGKFIAAALPSPAVAGQTTTEDILKNSGLSTDDAATLAAAVKAGVNQSLTASVSAALSAVDTAQSLFAYELRLDELDADSRAAVNAALAADLSQLNALEAGRKADGTIAPGVKLVRSIIGSLQERKVTVDINLLGILNFTSVRDFFSNFETITGESGDVTLKVNVGENRISAITDNLKREAALRKALFDSILVTMAYSAAGALRLSLGVKLLHFVLNQKTSAATFQQYERWFQAFGLKAPDPGAFTAGADSSCLIRAEFDPNQAPLLFLDAAGHARPSAEYLDAGRGAIMGLLDPGSPVTPYRQAFLENTALFQQAMEVVSADQVKALLSPQAQENQIFLPIYSDFLVARWWAESVADLAKSLQDFNANAGAGGLEALRREIGDVVKNSPVQFGEPVGVVALSSIVLGQKYGKIWTPARTFEATPTVAPAVA
jgi:hypothetical protein